MRKGHNQKHDECGHAAFLGDAEGTWTSSLALSTLIPLNEMSNARDRTP